MRILRLIFALFLMFDAVGLPAVAASDSANAPHVQVQFLVLPQGLNRGRPAEAGLYFKLDPGWHIYWMNAGDAGEPPRVRWTLPEGITAGALQFPAPTRLPLGPLMDYGYVNDVLFPLTLNVAKTAKPGTQVLHAKVDWLVCQSSCIPGRAELEISREIYEHPAKPASSAADSATFNRFIRQLPKSLPADYKVAFQPSKSGFRLLIATGQKETYAAFFPAEQGILDNSAAQKREPTPTGLILDLKKQASLNDNPLQLTGVLELSGGRAFALVAVPSKIALGASFLQPSASSVSSPVASSVSPIVPEPSSLANLQAPAQFNWLSFIRSELFAFLGGLILNLMPCVFPVLFLKGLALVNARNEELRHMRAHGFVYTSGILLSFWSLVALLLALRLAGSKLGWGFQFQSPVFLALMAGLLFFLGLSLAGQFEIGVTLTSAGGSLASKQGYTGSFFTGVLAVIVATPCTAPFMGTAIGYALAQPAAVTFAVFTGLALGLAAPYLALAMQPAWTRLLPRPGTWMEILKQAISIPIFATVIWLAWVLAQAYGAGMLAALLASFLLLAVAGWFLGRWPGKRWATAVAAMILLATIVSSVIAPRKLIVPSEAAVQTGSKGDDWEPWSVEAVNQYRAQKRPVFVDFTASWCLSCQVNERVALSRPEVQRAFADAGVILLRADWTRHDEAITQILAELGSGVPAYVLYNPGQSVPQLLPEVLTPGVVMDALAKLPKTDGPKQTAALSNPGALICPLQSRHASSAR